MDFPPVRVRSMTARLLLAALVPLLAAMAFPVSGNDGVLVLGRISDDPRHHYGQLKPLLDYVVPRMAEVGIVEGRILMASDALQMQRYLRRGRVDWVTETPAMAVQLGRRVGARTLLATERGGVDLYHTVVFVREDSPVRTLADLRGRSLALQRAASTSAYYAPAMSILGAGLNLEPLLSPSDSPDPANIGYLFAGSEHNILAWVRVGLSDAGAFSNLDWQAFGLDRPMSPPRLRVIHRTQHFPRAVELVRADLPEPVAERLREVLLGAADDPEAGPALRSFFDTTGFKRIDRETERLLVALGDGVARVREELE